MRYEDFAFGNLEELVQPDRVHRSVYIDRNIFELEMERIFCRSWVFVGHDSQVPTVGDFMATTIGSQPVLLVRHSDGKVHVLHNRCGHRGALVCNEQIGNTGRNFRCAYHGWTFKTNGELLAAPLKNGYPEQYDLKAPEFGMVPIRAESYRGFIFANILGSTVSFDDYMDAMKVVVDDVADRSPLGTVTVGKVPQRYLYRGNWKEQVDNGGDGYHPPYGHESTISRGDRQFKRREGQDQGAIIAEPGNGQSIWDKIDLYTANSGNNYMGHIPGADEPRSGKAWEEYMRSMERSYGNERTQEIVREKFHAAMFYPNFILHMLSHHVRVVHPITVDLTEVRVYPISLDGAPAALNQANIRYLNVTHSPASLIQTDDLECFRRVHEGLRNSGAEWVTLGRGFGQQREIENGVEITFGTSELAIRNYYQTWKTQMTAKG